MPTYELGINIVGHDRASGPLSGVRRALERIGEVALGVVAARALERIAEGLFYVAGEAINAAAKFEMMQLALAGLAAREMVQLSDATLTVSQVFGEAEVTAKGLMDELSRIAILSPYQVDAVHYTYKMAMAFGYTTKEAMDFTEATLNMAAGIGADASMLQRMAYNLSQVRLQGKVTALDIRQLALAGFDLRGVLKYVSTQMGYNIEDHNDFNKLIAEGKVTWEDFTRLYSQYADTMFSGASERMARSLYGLKSTFNDVFLLTMPTVVGPALEEVSGVLNRMLDLFLTLRESGVLEVIGEQLRESVAKFLQPAAKAVEYIEKNIAGVKNFSDLLDLVELALYDAFGPGVVTRLFDFARTIGGVFASIAKAIGALITGDNEGVIGALGLSGPLADLALKVLDGIEDAFRRIRNALGGLLDLDFNTFVEALELPPQVEDALFSLVRGFGSLGEFVVTYGPQLISVFGDFIGRLLGLTAPAVVGGVDTLASKFEQMAAQLLENGPQIVASFDEFLTKVTDEWLPAVGELFSKIIDEWIPGLIRVGDWLANNLVPILGVLASTFIFVKSLALVPLIQKAYEVLTAFGMMAKLVGGWGPLFAIAKGIALPALGSVLSVLGPIVLALAAIAGTVAVVAIAWKNNWGGIQEKVAAVGGAIMDVLKPAFDQLKASWELMKPALEQLWAALEPVVTFIGTVAAVVIGGALTLLIGLITGLINGIAGFVTTAMPYLVMFVEGFTTIINGIVGFVTGFWDIIVGLFTGNTDRIVQGANKLWQGLVNIVLGLVQGITGLISGLVAGVLGLLAGFVQGVVQFFVNLYNRLVGHSIIPDMVKGILKAFKDFFVDAIKGFSDWVGDLIDKFLNLAGRMMQIGKNIVQGLWDGIKAVWDSLVGWLTKKIQGILDLFDKIFKMESPSKAMGERGMNMMLGLRQGVLDYAKQPIGAVRAVAMAAQAAAQGVEMNNTFYVRDQLDAEIIARRVKQLLVEETTP